MLFAYPSKTKFGRVVPKTKIYEHSDANTEIQRKFIEEIEQINWAYKLSPETLNITADNDVSEIQVFTLRLRSGEVSEETLRTIDSAIPFPLLFELEWDNQIQTVAAFKRRSDADTSKWVVSNYFWSGWLPTTTQRKDLPTAIDMSSFYEKLIRAIVPIKAREEERAREQIERIDLAETKQKEIARLQSKLKREKQFNRKVELNKQLKNLRCELKELLA